jgi:hypothetical protein
MVLKQPARVEVKIGKNPKPRNRVQEASLTVINSVILTLKLSTAWYKKVREI